MKLWILLNTLTAGQDVELFDADGVSILFDTVENIGSDYDDCIVKDIWATVGDTERAIINIGIEYTL